MNELCNNNSTEDLEKVVLAGMDYFKGENLWEYVQEYSELLDVKFHTEANFEKASTYFFLSYEENENCFNEYYGSRNYDSRVKHTCPST